MTETTTNTAIKRDTEGDMEVKEDKKGRHETTGCATYKWLLCVVIRKKQIQNRR